MNVDDKLTDDDSECVDTLFEDDNHNHHEYSPFDVVTFFFGKATKPQVVDFLSKSLANLHQWQKPVCFLNIQWISCL